MATTLEPRTDFRSEMDTSKCSTSFFIWREFMWGGIAGAFGEGIMHPIDTLKTRLQSQAVLRNSKAQKNILQMVQTVWLADGFRGFYRGIAPGLTGSLATGATYFGVIESTKKWVEELHPSLGGHWTNFIAGGIGDTLGSVVYVPCEVMKQRMQVQGSRKSWSSVMESSKIAHKSGADIYGYYNGMLHAGYSIWKQQGLRGLYAGFGSTLARDVPFAGLMVTCYEALKDFSEYGKKKFFPRLHDRTSGSIDGLLLGGLAGGFSAYLTTPLDVIKTRMQVQGSSIRYNGWLDAVQRTWKDEGLKGMFRGSVPRILWYVPASAFTFMAVEFLREQFKNDHQVSSLTIDSGTKMKEVV